MIINELITIGTTPDVRTNPMGTAPCISAAPASDQCPGHRVAERLYQRSPLIERVNKLNLDRAIA